MSWKSKLKKAGWWTLKTVLTLGIVHLVKKKAPRLGDAVEDVIEAAGGSVPTSKRELPPALEKEMGKMRDSLGKQAEEAMARAKGKRK